MAPFFIMSNTDSPKLIAVNQILSSIGQTPLQEVDLTNPDVAIITTTLDQVNTEVQSEGWAFNQEYGKEEQTGQDKTYIIPADYLQVDISDPTDKDVVKRTSEDESKLYDRKNHTFELSSTPNGKIKVDIIKLIPFEDTPIPIRSFIIARTATLTAQRIVGDPVLIQNLQLREGVCRSTALEYDCNQANYTMFGYDHGQGHYNSYKPFKALMR